MKFATFLMGDHVSKNSGYFLFFMKNLTNNSPRIAFNSALNIESILENYDIPAEKYGPMLLQQVIDLLASAENLKLHPQHQKVLKNIACKLSEILDENDFLGMTKSLFKECSSLNLMSGMTVSEVCQLIQSYECPKTNRTSIKKKRLSKSGTSSFMNISNRKGSNRDLSKNLETKSAPDPKDQKLLRPTQLYSKILKIFSACGILGNLFKRENPGYPEYCQNVLSDFEKKFEAEFNIKLCFFLDSKDPFRLQKCSHYSIVKLKNELLQRNPKISEYSDSGVVALLNNQSLLLSACHELINILEVEKLEKQSGNWEMVMPLPIDKKKIRQFRPKGRCLATLFSNTGKIKVLTKGKDKMFFSASNQGEIRVFDFKNFSEQGKSLLCSKIDINSVVDQTKKPRKNSFSTCPDT
jgi:hypothetical protein